MMYCNILRMLVLALVALSFTQVESTTGRTSTEMEWSQDSPDRSKESFLGPYVREVSSFWTDAKLLWALFIPKGIFDPSFGKNATNGTISEATLASATSEPANETEAMVQNSLPFDEWMRNADERRDVNVTLHVFILHALKATELGLLDGEMAYHIYRSLHAEMLQPVQKDALADWNSNAGQVIRLENVTHKEYMWQAYARYRFASPDARVSSGLHRQLFDAVYLATGVCNKVVPMLEPNSTLMTNYNKTLDTMNKLFPVAAGLKSAIEKMQSSLLHYACDEVAEILDANGTFAQTMAKLESKMQGALSPLANRSCAILDAVKGSMSNGMAAIAKKPIIPTGLSILEFLEKRVENLLGSACKSFLSFSEPGHISTVLRNIANSTCETVGEIIKPGSFLKFVQNVVNSGCATLAGMIVKTPFPEVDVTEADVNLWEREATLRQEEHRLTHGVTSFDVYEQANSRFLNLTIAIAIFGDPENGTTDNIELLTGYSQHQREHVSMIKDKISGASGEPAVRMALVYVSIKSAEIDIDMPVFRVYNVHNETNKLQNCYMAFPAHGIYSKTSDGRVDLEFARAPSGGLPMRLVRSLDELAQAVAHHATTAIIVFGATPIGEGATVVYNIAQFFDDLVYFYDQYDRLSHKEDVVWFDVAGRVASRLPGPERMVAKRFPRIANSFIRVKKVTNLLISGQYVAHAYEDLMEISKTRPPTNKELTHFLHMMYFFRHDVIRHTAFENALKENAGRTPVEKELAQKEEDPEKSRRIRVIDTAEEALKSMDLSSGSEAAAARKEPSAPKEEEERGTFDLNKEDQRRRTSEQHRGSGAAAAATPLLCPKVFRMEDKVYENLPEEDKKLLRKWAKNSKEKPRSYLKTLKEDLQKHDSFKDRVEIEELEFILRDDPLEFEVCTMNLNNEKVTFKPYENMKQYERDRLMTVFESSSLDMDSNLFSAAMKLTYRAAEIYKGKNRWEANPAAYSNILEFTNSFYKDYTEKLDRIKTLTDKEKETIRQEMNDNKQNKVKKDLHAQFDKVAKEIWDKPNQDRLDAVTPEKQFYFTTPYSAIGHFQKHKKINGHDVKPTTYLEKARNFIKQGLTDNRGDSDGFIKVIEYTEHGKHGRRYRAVITEPEHDIVSFYEKT